MWGISIKNEVGNRRKASEVGAFCFAKNSIFFASYLTRADFSRLGRDHLETGNLLERIFPLLGIRFISVNDSFDSAECDGMTGGLNVALKNVMNAMYSRDLSNKVQSAMRTRARARSGQYMSAKVSYGYLKIRRTYTIW